MPKDGYLVARKNMVKLQIRERGIKDERVISAMEEVPRHKFVPKEMRKYAYYDCPSPIGEGQTISQPYMVALMSELLELKGDEKVLEIGTGSGYQTAILSKLAKTVVSVEIKENLAENARKTLGKTGCRNVSVITGDGSKGYVKDAPYERIIVTAACEEVPEELFLQLDDGGILVIPVGGMLQTLWKIRKSKDKFSEEAITSCVFVPLLKDQL